MVQRPLDHVAIATTDVDSTGRDWEALGFRVLPKMRHLAIGSCNRIVQFGHTYVEFLGDLDRMIEPYGSSHRHRFEWGNGIVNLCFRSENLEDDRQTLIAASVDMQEPGSARRPVVMPDGSNAETDSNFCSPLRKDRPFMSPFLVMHRKPETIYVPEYAVHANTAMDIIGATCLSSDPQSDGTFFKKICGTEPELVSGGVRVTDVGGVTIDILDADTCMARFGNAAPPLDPQASGYGIGLTIAVASLAACRAAFAPRVRCIEAGASLLIPADCAGGTFVCFVER